MRFKAEHTSFASAFKGVEEEIASGITAAVIKAARKLPSRRKSTTITSSAPSVRLRSTVRIVRSTRSVRLSTVWVTIPGGSDGWMAASFTNNTGGQLTQFTVKYDGEQWSDAGDNGPPYAQTMNFECVNSR